MKKTLLLFSLFLFSIALHAQSLIGVYSSNYTTYEEELHPENNYEENNLFHIAIEILNNDEGWIGVQDSRAIDDINFYTIKSFLGTLEKGERQKVRYQAETVNLPEPKETELVIFFEHDNSKNEISKNLMIIQEGTSQIFYDLKLISED